MMLIGVSGKARSGKDTAAKILFLQEGFMRLAIADPVKDTAAALWGVDPQDFHDDTLKDVIEPRWGITRRHMMQKIGEMVKVNMGEQFWMLHWFNRYSLIGEMHPVVVTDIRFDYEAERIIQLGGTIIEIVRDGSGLSGSDANHVSEQGIRRDLISHTLENHAHMDDFKTNLMALVQKIRGNE